MSAPLPSRISRRFSKLSDAVSRTVRDLRPLPARSEWVAGRSGAGRAVGGIQEGVQSLEARTLFTTLVGGDIFEYTTQDPSNPTQFVTNRIVLRGNIVAELVGGALSNPNNANSTVVISDVPGSFYQSTVRGVLPGQTQDYLGGTGGGSGVQPVAAGNQVISIFDPISGNDVDAAATAGFNMKATAVDGTGQLYGFNVFRTAVAGTAGEQAFVQVVQIDASGTQGTVVAVLNARLNPNVTTNSNFVNANGVTDVTAAAYNPVTGLMYFVVRGTDRGVPPATNTGAPTPLPTQQLFSINLSAGTPQAILASMVAVPGSLGRNVNNNNNVTAMVWDRTGQASAELRAYVVDSVNGVARGRLVDINVGTGGFTNQSTPTFGNVNPTAITGISIINDNAAGVDNQIYAVETGDTAIIGGTVAPVLTSATVGPQVLLINRGTGTISPLGRLAAPGAAAGDVGLDLQSLTYASAVRNPFTGALGALLSVDNTTRQEVFVDARNRFPGVSSFAIYISQSDATGEIIVGRVDADDPNDDEDNLTTDRPMQPFEGTAGTVRVLGTNGQEINVTSPAGVGGVFLGLKSSGNDADSGTFDNVLAITGTLSQALGVRPAGTVRAGIVSSATLLKSLTGQTDLASRLIGSSVTDVTGLAVTSTGAVYAVDSDGRDASGQTNLPDQLVQLDRNTGKVIGTPLNITNTLGQSAGSGRGLTTGTNDQLLAIFVQQFANTGNPIDPTDPPVGGGGGTTPLTPSINFATAGTVPISFSISGSGLDGYILATQGSVRFLYSFSRPDLTTSPTFAALGPIVDANQNLIAAASTLGINAAGQLYTIGYSAENPNPTQSTGGTPVDISTANGQNLTYASDGQIYLIGTSGGSITIRQVQRNLGTGALTGLGAAQTINVGGAAVFGLSDLTQDPNSGQLLGVGQSGGSLVPNTPSGTLTNSQNQSNFIYRGLTRLSDNEVYAVTSNGSTLELRKVASSFINGVLSTQAGTFNTVPSTPRTGAVGVGTDIRYDAPGAATGATTALLGISQTTSRPGDTTGIYGIGYSADALLPTQRVLGALGNIDVSQLSASGTIVTYNYLDASYVFAVGGVTYRSALFGAAGRDTSTGALLSGGTESYGYQIVGQGAANANTPAYPSTVGGTPAGENYHAARNSVVNGIADLRANATYRRRFTNADGFVTAGFNIDSPVPAAPIPGDLGIIGGYSSGNGGGALTPNLRSMTFAEPIAGTLEDAYSVYFNGTGFDVYRLQRNQATGGVASYTRISTGVNNAGLVDPTNGELISFVYTIFRDPNTPNRYFITGSSAPTAGTTGQQAGPLQSLYALDISGSTVTVLSKVDLSIIVPVPPPGITAPAVPAADQTYFKAGAINDAGEMYLVREGDGFVLGINSPSPNSEFYRVDRTTGICSFLGFVTTLNFGAAITGTGALSGRNSDIRAMQFHIDSDGNEKLVLLDKGNGTGNGLLSEIDMNSTFKTRLLFPQFPGDVTSSLTGVPNGPYPVVAAIQSSLSGLVAENTESFAMDQYGRGYAFAPGSATSNDRIWVSPNELYFQERLVAGADTDGDNWIGENVRVGWLTNEDGTAYMDSITSLTADLVGDGARAIGVAVNELDSSIRPQDPLRNQEKLISFTIPGGISNVTTNGNGGGNQTRIVITPVRRTSNPNDAGVITVGGVASSNTPGAASNITGLAFTTDGTLVGLDRNRNGTVSTADDQFRLVAFPLDPTQVATGARTGNVTFNTQALTDANELPAGFSADPRGLASDSFGRLYSADGTTFNNGANPLGTNLLVSPNTTSLFRIDVATGVATKYIDLADAGLRQQTPVLSRFGGVAFLDSDTVYAVQKDVTGTGVLAINANGLAVGIDRLVTFDIPATATPGAAARAFERYNRNTGGTIQVGNTAAFPATPNGVATDITAMDFTQTGQLVAIDGASNRQVLINLDISRPTTSVAPTDSVYISGPGTTAGLFGFSRTPGTSTFTTIDTSTSPDRLLVGGGGVSLIRVAPGTGAAATVAPLTLAGAAFPLDRTVVALATEPNTGIVYAIVRGPDTVNGGFSDFLYTIQTATTANATAGAATLVGLIRRSKDASGATLPTAGTTRIISIDFNDQGRLLALNDASAAGANDRNLMIIDQTSPALSIDVRGSVAGSVGDGVIGIASDANDGGANVPLTPASPTYSGGRLYTLDASAPTTAQLLVTPTQLYLLTDATSTYPGSSGVTVPAITAAQFAAVGPLTPATGGAYFDTIVAMDFTPPSVGEQLYAVSRSTSGDSLVVIPTTPGGDGSLGVTGGIPIVVTSAAQFTDGPAVTPILTPQAAIITSITALADGTLRAIEISQGDARIIDIRPSDPAASTAKTDPGGVDGALIGFQVDNTDRFYALSVANNVGTIYFVTDGRGIIDITGDLANNGGGNNGGTNAGAGTITAPALGSINPTTGVFTAIGGASATPGKLDAAITDVTGFAFDRLTSKLYVVDQNSILYEISATTAGILRTIGTVRDPSTNSTITVGSMAFDASGRLIVQDIGNGRAVEVSTSTALVNTARASANGSLPPTVGAIAFDPIGGRFLAVDNSTGAFTTSQSSTVSSQLLQFSTDLSAASQDIGKIFVGGTITGGISLGGSVDQFYAGWVITGSVNNTNTDSGRLLGLGNVGASNPAPGNFTVAGDLRQFVTVGSFGGTTASIRTTNTPVNVQFLAGTDLLVQGRIGSVRGLADMVGTIRAMNTAPDSGLGSTTTELEYVLRDADTSLADQEGFSFEAGFLHGTDYTNNTAATAQRLFPGTNPNGTSSGAITVFGQLQNAQADPENVDYYAIPMLAGQFFSVQLSSSFAFAFGVFDPDGRLVMTNRPVNGLVNLDGTYRVKAERPGEYRIAIAQQADDNFDGTASSEIGGALDYVLTVSNLGDLAIGAVTFGGSIADLATTTARPVLDFSAIYAATGDIGGIFASNGFVGNSSTTSNSVRAQTGAIRSIEAATIGTNIASGALFVSSGISVSAGTDVGLIRSTAGPLILNRAVVPTATTGGGLVATDFIRVGGSYQTLSASTNFVGTVYANKGLGNLLAGSMGTTSVQSLGTTDSTVSTLNVNADGVGNDGTIDMVDVTGDLGTLQGGGPAIYTNGGGNVRYIRVGGTLYRDRGFGGGGLNAIQVNPGEALNFVDDSGARLTIDFDPRTLVLNPAFDPSVAGSLRYVNAPQITYTPYAIRGGGSVLVNLTVTNLGHNVQLEPNTPQLRITSSGPGGNAEISTLTLQGTDVAQTVTTVDNTTTFTGGLEDTTTTGYRVGITGSARVDVSRVNVQALGGATGGTGGNITAFTNNTGGELLDFNANSVGTLDFSGSIGMARPSVTGAQVVTATPLAIAIYPFAGYPFIVQPGTVAVISTGESLGHVLATNIGDVYTNAGGRDNPDNLVEGIAGPVVSTGLINRVRIGEGIASAGQGDVAGGMLIAVGRINIVEGSSDIRGTIASQNSIGTVSLGGNGALINASLLVYTPVSTAAPYNDVSPTNIVTLLVPDTFIGTGSGGVSDGYEIDRVSIAGGIIGSQITANDVRTVSAGGFGLLQTFILSNGGGRIESISAAGYGIRNVDITFFSSIGRITATGNGSNLSTSSITPSVRRSESETVDVLTGVPFSNGSDIHAFLTTSAATPIINGVTTTGVIENLVADGNGSLSSISAYTIRGSQPGTLNTFLSFGNSIGSITTKTGIDGLEVRTGRLGTFAPGGDVTAFNLFVAGPISKFKIKGNLGNNSTVTSSGPSGTIGSFEVTGNFDGSLTSSGRVKTVKIGGNFTNGSININPVAGRGASLASLTVGGSIAGTSINVIGDIGTISVAGSFGSAGDTLTVNGNLGTLNVGTNRKSSPGKVLASNVNVTGAIKAVNVRGRLTGSLTAAGSISTLKVESDGDANRNLIAGDVTSTGGDINNLTVTNGDIAANVTAFNKLNNLTVTRGSVLAGKTVSTVANAIGKVNIKGGNLFGSVRAGSSTSLRAINSITVDGQVGDGTNDVAINGSSLKTLKVGRDVFSRTTVDIAGPIGSLTINGELQSGATIKATSIGKQKIGTINGTIIIA